MNRANRFLALKNHAWYKKLFAKLRQKDVRFAVDWIAKHDHLTRDEFEKAVNRLALDNPVLRESYENFPRIQELIASTNVGAEKEKN